MKYFICFKALQYECVIVVSIKILMVLADLKKLFNFWQTL